MKEDAVKTKLNSGQSVYGLLSPIYDPQVVEVLAHLGFECYMLDCEHGAGSAIEAESFVRTCEAVGITPLARIRSTDAKLILQFLDAGIMGVMMPGIRDVFD